MIVHWNVRYPIVRLSHIAGFHKWGIPEIDPTDGLYWKIYPKKNILGNPHIQNSVKIVATTKMMFF